MTKSAIDSTEINDNQIDFSLKDDDVPILSLRANGDIFVKGKLIENDKEVVGALREYLIATGHLI